MIGWLAILTVFNSAYALRCYKCNDAKSCQWNILPFVHLGTEICDASPNSVILSILNYLTLARCTEILGRGKSGEEHVVERGCTHGVPNLWDCHSKVKNSDFLLKHQLSEAKCHTCDSFLCNTQSESMDLTIYIAVILAVVLIIIRCCFCTCYYIRCLLCCSLGRKAKKPDVKSKLTNGSNEF